MRVLFINEVCGHTSTGKICAEQAKKLYTYGHEVKIAYGRSDYVPEKYQKFAIKIGTKFDVFLHGVYTRLLDGHGFLSKNATKQFLQWADNYNPDLLWLHNLHGYYINVELLFDWIKSRSGMKVNWTLHDCWSFTGHCTYFSFAKCEKWKTHCDNCPEKKSYPASFLLDRSYSNYDRKHLAFTGVNNMTLITPSYWLADLVSHSFLSEYSVKVVHNTIDKAIFKPTKSNFREKYNLTGKKIVLGVSNAWHEPRKGLNDFYAVRQYLDDSFAIVLVGLTKTMIARLPSGIIGLLRTNNSRDLAEIYTAADIFFNPTYEDNYPTVNIEAQACGTPVITYKTGGSPESVVPENVVDVGNIRAAVKRMEEIVYKG